MTTAFILSTTGIGVNVGVEVGTFVSVGMGVNVSVGGGDVSVKTKVGVTESTCPVGVEAGALHEVNMRIDKVKKIFIFILMNKKKLFD